MLALILTQVPTMTVRQAQVQALSWDCNVWILNRSVTSNHT